MNKTIGAMTLAAVAAASGAAAAADLPRGPTPYYSQPAPYYNWSGLYAGVNAGYEWGHVTSSNIDPSGIAGGGQVGYNWQNGQFVFGGETDIQASAADDTFAPWKFSNPWFGTLRGRAGFALNNILFYGTGGLAYGDLRAELGRFAETQTLAGWTLGAGMEVGFTSNWSAKIEFLHTNIGNASFTLTGASNGMQSNMLRFGVNYRF